MTLPNTLPIVASLLFGLALASTVTAQTQPAEKPADEWVTLMKRKESLVSRLQQLQQDFAAAEADEKAAIRAEFAKVVDEYENRVSPQIEALAPKIYAADPKNYDAAEAVMEAAFSGNRFEEAARVADELIAAGRDSVYVVNVSGVSHFATHDFEQAHEILKSAEQEGKLHPRLGRQYLEAAKQYVDFWKNEQQIRAREAAAPPAQQLPRVSLQTNQGKIVLELFENEAPNSVANFISLVEADKYDGTKFHRVIDRFMVQGGDPNSLDDDPSNDGTGGPGYHIACECVNDNARMHFRGSLSMAHAGRDTGGSQFFITHLPTPHLNANVGNQSEHTVFGRVIEGMDVVAGLQKNDEIVEATVLRKRDHAYKPKTLPAKPR